MNTKQPNPSVWLDPKLMLAGTPVHMCFFFQKEMSLRFFGGWGCNLLLRIFSNSRPGKKQRLSLILNELLVVRVFKTE